MGLEEKLYDEPSIRKVAAVDTAGTICYSLIAGTIIDIASGCTLWGVIATRATATVANCFLGGPWGWWREKTYRLTRTTEESGRVRQTLTELLAFNTFNIPAYGVVLSIGSLISEGHVDMEKVYTGMEYTAMASPIIALSMGWFLDKFRKIYKIKSAAQGAYSKK